MRSLRAGGILVLLYMAYVVLFLAGAAALGPEIAPDALTPAEQSASLGMTLVVAAIDLAIMGVWVARARFGGWRLWAVTSLVMYGVKTFSSNLETWYFVDAAHVPPEMLPSLFAMTLPLCVIWPALLVWGLGPRGDTPGRPVTIAPAALAVRVAVAGVVLYPIFFFVAGYWIAWQNPAVRAYYGGAAVPLPILRHLAETFAGDPFLLPFEMIRGLLWVAIGWPVLRWSRGPWWAGALLFATMMALVQNDLHLLPNPLMPPEVRWWHFIETTSSNFLFAWCAAALIEQGYRAIAPARSAPRVESAP
ncbi:MAG: hypothetical protein V4850_07405 [Myxococcota bacterium]